ncbi:MAG: PilZ domain-containing protein [Conexivisphaerales archaeon]
MPAPDKREHNRYKTSIKCKVGLKYGKVVPGVVLDLSARGAKISVDDNDFSLLVKEGDIILLLMKDKIRVKAECKVKWISKRKRDTIIGVEFLEVEEDFSLLLSSYAMSYISDIYFR